MDRIFDRIGGLLRTLLGGSESGDGGYDPLDPDMRAAYVELDAYLRGEAPAGTTRGARPGPEGPEQAPEGPDETLRGDFAALEVPFGADMARVRSAYKGLLMRYHPDRFAGDPEKQRLATDVTQRLNASFRRVETHYRGTNPRRPSR